MKNYIETLREANNRGYTHIEIDGQLREITDIIAADTGDDCGTWTLDDGSIEHLNADGLRTGDVQRLVSVPALPLLMIPSTAICDSALGDLGDAGLVYETAADAETHLIETVEDQCYGDDCSESDCERIARQLLAAAVTLDNPTADQIAEAAEHRISPTYCRNGHSVGVRVGDLSAAHRAALDGGDEVLTSDGAVIRGRRSSNGRRYYTARLQPGYVWSDRGSYSKNPTPVRA